MKKHRVKHGDRKPPTMMFGKRYPYMTNLFKELGFTTGVEIGVRGAPFSQQMGRSMPGLKWWGIDPYRSYGHYAARGGRCSQESMDQYYLDALKALAPYDCTIIREFSHVAVKRFDDDSLDFIHIDGNHEFEYAYQDIELWTEKVRPGGIISCHDYMDLYDTRSRVKSAVDKWTGEHNIFPWFIIVGSSTPTCFWVKEGKETE